MTTALRTAVHPMKNVNFESLKEVHTPDRSLFIIGNDVC